MAGIGGMMMATPYLPLVAEPSWTAFRDAAYSLIVAGMDQAARPEDRLAYDRLSAERLAAVTGDDDRPERPGRDHLLASVAAVGYDVGRHVYAKDVVEDQLSAAIGALSTRLERAELGHFDLEDHLHRKANARFTARELGAACRPDVLEAYVAGLLQGTVTEALNTPVVVAIDPAEGRAKMGFVLHLGQGHDVNARAARSADAAGGQTGKTRPTAAERGKT